MKWLDCELWARWSTLCIVDDALDTYWSINAKMCVGLDLAGLGLSLDHCCVDISVSKTATKLGLFLRLAGFLFETRHTNNNNRKAHWLRYRLAIKVFSYVSQIRNAAECTGFASVCRSRRLTQGLCVSCVRVFFLFVSHLNQKESGNTGTKNDTRYTVARMCAHSLYHRFDQNDT